MGRHGSRFDLILHSVTGSFDDNGLGMVEEAVQDGRGDGAVIVENGGPLLEGLVGGQNDGAALVTAADDLKEEVGAVLVDGKRFPGYRGGGGASARRAAPPGGIETRTTRGSLDGGNRQRGIQPPVGGGGSQREGSRAAI